MKNLVILRGLPGAGKSTIAGLISRAICCADDYFMKNGIYLFNRNKLHSAHMWCMRKCEMFLKRNIDSVVVANTSTTDKEILPYKELASKYGYKFHSIIVENRHGNKNVHGVPEETINKMKDRFSISL